MTRVSLDEHLSQISTIWSALRQAHEGAAGAAALARQLLLERYGGAVLRYLTRLLGDADAADDLTQEFALALVRGDFRRADPRRGRFRDYVKTVLYHLVIRHTRQRRRQPLPLPPDNPALAGAAGPSEDHDREFRESWRDELLTRAWAALADAHAGYHAVLRFRAEHPKMRSEEMARRLRERTGKAWTADGVRQTLRRARERFADLLLDDVARSLERPTAAAVEQELRELDLLDYCRPALDRRGRR
jgi:RNA polymerase sigma-70 factor (ECF subfamily)